MNKVGLVRKTNNSLRERIRKNKASAVVIDGQMGEGKTTFAVKLLEDFQHKKQIDYNMQYAVGGDDFLTKLELCVDNKKKAIIYDEAGDFSRKATLTKFNRTLDMVFQTFRTYRILIIIVLPFFAELDRGIYDRGVIRVLFNCYGRNEEAGKLRVYSLRRIFYLLDYIRKKQHPVRQMAYKNATPLYYTHFKDLPPERSEELDIISTMQKRERLRNTNNGDFRAAPFVKEVMKEPEKYLNSRGKITKPKLMAFLGLTDRQAGVVREFVEVELQRTQTGETNI